MSSEGKFLATHTWVRGGFILLFWIIQSIAKMVIQAVALFQFLTALVTGKPNERLMGFSRELTRFVYQILQYVTYCTDQKPYPFSAWPVEVSEETHPVEHKG